MKWFHRRLNRPEAGAEERSDSWVPEAGWAVRLHAIGRALDRAGTTLQSLAVAMASDTTLISALAFRESLFSRPTWIPVTFQIAHDGSIVPVASSEGSIAHLSSSVPGKPWTETLVALGLLLDQRPPLYGDLLILEVDGGFVVQGLRPSASDERPGQVLVSWEFTNGELAAVIASFRHGRAA